VLAFSRRRSKDLGFSREASLRARILLSANICTASDLDGKTVAAPFKRTLEILISSSNSDAD